MTDEKKMRVWDALKTTDPKYTKKVEFGRKFTSINSQWQLQRMTEHFGPIGEGWGYSVDHAIAHLSPDYMLAIADVTIWWGPEKNHYGPVRGMSPIVEKGKNGLHFDDDAGKKAMTDALTKGLSHLGLSADVFLGLFDDNKYVQQVKEQFANGEDAGGIPEADRGLLKNGETRSTYQVAHADKSSGRLTAELWASQVLGMFKLPGFDLLQYKEWKVTPCTNKGTKTNEDRLIEMREKHSDLAQAIDEAVDGLGVAYVAKHTPADSQ